MKRFFVKLLIFLIILAGAAWLLYPYVSNTIAKGNDAAAMSRYHQAVRQMSSEEIEKIRENVSAYNAELTGEGIPDVFSETNLRVSRDYLGLMNIRDGVIGELVIPGIGVSLPIYHMGNGAGAGERLIHVADSALPADQDGTHTVLAGPGIQLAEGFLGELTLTNARMLEDLDRVIPKDLIFLNVLDRTLIYQVEGVQTLAPEGLKAENVSGEEGEQLLTIVTERKGRRLLIRARQVEAEDVRDELMAEDRADVPMDAVNVLALGVPVLLLGLLIMMIIERFKKRSYRLPTEIRERKKTEPEQETDRDETDDEVKNPER